MARTRMGSTPFLFFPDPNEAFSKNGVVSALKSFETAMRVSHLSAGK